jgi:hypothetical protein
LPPVDNASLTASVLNSSVYRRFGTVSFFPISPSAHQKVTNNLMYVKPGQGHSPIDSRIGNHPNKPASLPERGQTANQP